MEPYNTFGKVDHTYEVEVRVSAIRISGTDYCAFFKSKNDTPMFLRQCQYCMWAVFEATGQEPYNSGFCKFSR